MSLHLLRRKLQTFSTTVARVRNWPAVSFARLGWGTEPRVSVQLRDGLVLEPLHPLHATWGEIFEPAIADLYGVRALAASSEPPDLVVDVGANVGAFACFAGWLLPKARVEAFEPSAEHADQFERNVVTNRLKNVSLHRRAVTRDGRDITFQVNAEGGSSGIFLPGDRTVRLTSVALDAVEFYGARRCFIKLDCEGAEGEILPWLCEHRASLPPALRIACEFHHWSPLSLADSAELLARNGFAVTTPVRFDEQYLFADSGW